MALVGPTRLELLSRLGGRESCKNSLPQGRGERKKIVVVLYKCFVGVETGTIFSPTPWRPGVGSRPGVELSRPYTPYDMNDGVDVGSLITEGGVVEGGGPDDPGRGRFTSELLSV